MGLGAVWSGSLEGEVGGWIWCIYHTIWGSHTFGCDHLKPCCSGAQMAHVPQGGKAGVRKRPEVAGERRELSF